MVSVIGEKESSKHDILTLCCLNVVGPTLGQHWLNVSYMGRAFDCANSPSVGRAKMTIGTKGL